MLPPYQVTLAPNDRRQAGLFHTAFLMPSRADLARWLGFVGQAGVSLQGASDHIVSEAIYLADPEGNGIEVYADRPVPHWRTPAGEIHMTTERLDMQDLLDAAGDSAWAGFPPEGIVGHVHLQVGAQVVDRDVDVVDAPLLAELGGRRELAGGVVRPRDGHVICAVDDQPDRRAADQTAGGAQQPVAHPLANRGRPCLVGGPFQGDDRRRRRAPRRRHPFRPVDLVQRHPQRSLRGGEREMGLGQLDQLAEGVGE